MIAQMRSPVLIPVVSFCSSHLLSCCTHERMVQRWPLVERELVATVERDEGLLLR